MVYNTTLSSMSIGAVFDMVNNVTNGWIMVLLLLAIYVIMFLVVLRFGASIAGAVAGVTTFALSLMLMSAGLVKFYFVGIIAILAIIGVLATQIERSGSSF